MKNILRNEKAIALVTVLVIVLISSIVVSIIYYLIQKSTEVSGIEKRYQTAREASLGAIEVFTKEIIPHAMSDTTLTTTSSLALTNAVGVFASGLNAQVAKGSGVTDACFANKLLKNDNQWTSASCTADNTSRDPSVAPDVVFTLKGDDGKQNYRVNAKIVRTITGNSDRSGIALEGLGVVQTGTGMIVPQHFPYMYWLEIQGQKVINPQERANFEVLYAY